MQYICKYQSPFGGITISADGNSLTGLWFDGQKYFAATLPAAHEEKQLPVFDQTRKWLDSYFSGENPGFTPPLHPEGSSFRQAVWEILLQIPYVETITYKDIAKEIARQQGMIMLIGLCPTAPPMACADMVCFTCCRAISFAISL